MTLTTIIKKSVMILSFSVLSLTANASERIAIMGAMDVEIEKLLPSIKNRQTVELRDHTFYTGTLQGRSVVVTKSGIGKVNAAVTTTELIREFGIDSIIFTGIAGATAPELEPNDVVISTKLVQYDIDLTAFGNEPGHMDGFDDRYFPADNALVVLATTAAHQFAGKQRVSQGIIATGDTFMANKTDVKAVRDEFEAAAVEMEGAAVAQVAALYEVPFVVIRTISDKADGSAHMDYEEMKEAASHNSSGIVLKMLENYAG